MTPYYADDWLTVLGGDCRAVLAELPAESVHCVVTSPPYWGLRDYGTATWIGGDEGCDHVERRARGDAGRVSTDNRGGNINPAPVDTPMQYRHTCGKCGAVRQDSQLGLEPTPEAYVENMVAVFREVRRVLRRDGTVWLNLGDSYASGEVGRHDGYNPTRANGTTTHKPFGPRRQSKPRTGLKPKDLVGIPWRVAFALQADGWYLRSDIIWAKPNPMPESVTDRPTRSHEYLFLLSKSPRYYWDADAVREAVSQASDFGRTRPDEAMPSSFGHHRSRLGNGSVGDPAGRNIRSVWTIATTPYGGSHFATFPRKLVEPCIKAGTSERGVCPECGAPWERVVERATGGPKFAPLAIESSGALPDGPGTHRNMGARYQKWLDANPPTTTGWRPVCHHYAAHLRDPDDELMGNTRKVVPATVLDPFAGSGTTGLVAQSLSRRAILIDLNPDYLRQVIERNRDIPLGLGA